MIVGTHYVGAIHDMDIDGDLLYVVNSQSGLDAVDVSAPESPVWVGNVSNAGGAYGVAVAADHVFATGSSGYWLIPRHCDDLVPVQLASFVAEAVADRIELMWRVGVEEDVSGYRVYRGTEGFGEIPIVAVAASNAREYRARDRDVTPGRGYGYRLVEVTSSGVEATLGTAVGYAAFPKPSVAGPHPNPFNPRTTIDVAMDASGKTLVRVHDPRGGLVRTLASRWLEAGTHAIVWDGRDSAGRPAASGVYYISVMTPGRSVVRTVTLLR